MRLLGCLAKVHVECSEKSESLHSVVNESSIVLRGFVPAGRPKVRTTSWMAQYGLAWPGVGGLPIR
jgi:hypothetical protein